MLQNSQNKTTNLHEQQKVSQNCVSQQYYFSIANRKKLNNRINTLSYLNGLFFMKCSLLQQKSTISAISCYFHSYFSLSLLNASKNLHKWFWSCFKESKIDSQQGETNCFIKFRLPRLWKLHLMKKRKEKYPLRLSCLWVDVATWAKEALSCLCVYKSTNMSSMGLDWLTLWHILLMDFGHHWATIHSPGRSHYVTVPPGTCASDFKIGYRQLVAQKIEHVLFFPGLKFTRVLVTTTTLSHQVISRSYSSSG